MGPGRVRSFMNVLIKICANLDVFAWETYPTTILNKFTKMYICHMCDFATQTVMRKKFDRSLSMNLYQNIKNLDFIRLPLSVGCGLYIYQETGQI